MTPPRIAIAHDYLTQRGGAERVVLALARAFPEAPIYTTLFEPGCTYPEFGELDVRTSWLNGASVVRRNHRAALPLLAAASSSIRIDADVVVASSSGWAHGFRTSGLKVVYCYSPARWLYEPNRYLGPDAPRSVSMLLRVLSPYLRWWDRRAATTADRYLAISTVTQDRIQRTYGIEAPVVPAPHSIGAALALTDAKLSNVPSTGYFLVVSRLLPYKNVDVVVRAFASRPDLNLVVVGSGPDKSVLEALAGSNVTFLEGLTDVEMMAAYNGCTALIAASHEDFGLTPLEAAAHGKPSAVLRWGGFLDTVIEDRTGVFFDAATPEDVGHAVDGLLARNWDAEALRQRAGDFSEAVFTSRIRQEVDELWRMRPAVELHQGGWLA